ncbi:MAG: hypothetical protein K1060chlam2_00383, partial [Chlamydiae bacterium]|nr:hypothetical protein [Chlamydiota bacterium]
LTEIQPESGFSSKERSAVTTEFQPLRFSGLRINVSSPSSIELLTPEEGTENVVSKQAMRVKEAIQKMVIDSAGDFISDFDFTTDGSLIDLLRKCGKVELEETVFGVTDTEIVKIKHVGKFILKKISLPRDMAIKKSRSVQNHLARAKGETLDEKVYDLFYKNPGLIITQQFPHANYAQREKMTYIWGEVFGVPEVIVIKAQDGIFSFHAFVKNIGSAREVFKKKPNLSRINVQSLQDVAMTDMLFENQDRNPGNMLVFKKESSKEYFLVPIDHALCFQQKKFKAGLFDFNTDYKPPHWINWEKAKEKLTTITRGRIMNFSAEQKIVDAKNNGLIISERIQERLRKNISCLQIAIRENEDITLIELYHYFRKN